LRSGRKYSALRRSRRPRHDATVPHLHGRLHPTLDVEQRPGTVRMFANSPEHQLPIDAIEEAFDVEIEHPVVAPAALASRAHRVDRRSSGPVAVGLIPEDWPPPGFDIA
jgi:hypothetical protein